MEMSRHSFRDEFPVATRWNFTVLTDIGGSHYLALFIYGPIKWLSPFTFTFSNKQALAFRKIRVFLTSSIQALMWLKTASRSCVQNVWGMPHIKTDIVQTYT